MPQFSCDVTQFFPPCGWNYPSSRWTLLAFLPRLGQHRPYSPAFPLPLFLMIRLLFGRVENSFIHSSLSPWRPSLTAEDIYCVNMREKVRYFPLLVCSCRLRLCCAAFVGWDFWRKLSQCFLFHPHINCTSFFLSHISPYISVRQNHRNSNVHGSINLHKLLLCVCGGGGKAQNSQLYRAKAEWGYKEPLPWGSIAIIVYDSHKELPGSITIYCAADEYHAENEKNFCAHSHVANDDETEVERVSRKSKNSRQQIVKTSTSQTHIKCDWTSWQQLDSHIRWKSISSTSSRSQQSKSLKLKY